MRNAELIERLEGGDVTTITAADCNFNLPVGKWFDSAPFEPMHDWLNDVWRYGLLRPHRYGSTDYAQWLVTEADGTKTNLGPGDKIERLADGSIRAQPQSEEYTDHSERVAALLKAEGG